MKIFTREDQGKNSLVYDWKRDASGRMHANASKKGGTRALAVIVMTWAIETPKVPFSKKGATAYVNASKSTNSKSVRVSDMSQVWRIMGKMGFCEHVGNGEYLCHPKAKDRLKNTDFVFIEEERRNRGAEE